ncbi:MAG: hypothetical protein E6J54_23160 [Deltaproteobacteria bacterium]|nr:MAG: hypothetical protein E6J54_23160 [Deltaproteobacteria bacterium]
MKARLRISAWSARTLPELTTTAVDKNLITRLDAVRLQRLHNMRARSPDEQGFRAQEVNTALEFCIQLVEKHW